MRRIHLVSLFLLGGFLFSVDRIFKHIALAVPHFSSYLWRPWIGWEYFENFGVAFGIPLPWFAAFIYTPIIFGVLLWHYKKRILEPLVLLGIQLILFGAISNLLDRIFYHFTIDYLRVFTAIINIADIMIVLGALLLLFKEIQKKKTYPH